MLLDFVREAWAGDTNLKGVHLSMCLDWIKAKVVDGVTGD